MSFFETLGSGPPGPKLEVIQFLKARARGLSIQELDDWILQSEDHRIVFSGEGKAERNGGRR